MAFCLQVFLAVLVTSGVFAIPTPVVEETKEVLGISDEDGGWSTAASIIRNCDGKDVVACIGAKAVGYMDRASRMGNFEITDGIILVGNVDRTGRAMTENEIERDIETSPEGKATRLLDLIAESVSRFFKTHYMEFKMPESVQESIDEARQRRPLGKPPKFPRKVFRRLLPILLFLKTYLSATFAKIGVFIVGKLALKAVILAKIALGIGAYLLYRSRTSVTIEHASHSFPESSYQSQPPSGWSGPYKRSVSDAHELAFAGQVPEHFKTE